jgi:hypothetical protein
MRAEFPSGPLLPLTRLVGKMGLLIVALALSVSGVGAQALPTGHAAPGIGFYTTFEAGTSSSGTVSDMSNAVSYTLKGNLAADLTVPIYFVVPPVQPAGFAGPTVGLGNVALDARTTIPLFFADYSPTATVAFPTGSASRGFSTGSVTYDLDNRLERDFGLVSPFVEVDIGNSENNMSSPTRRVVRQPFLTLGYMAMLSAGPDVHLFGRLTLSADAFYVEPWGTQTVFSRIVRPGTTGGGGTHNRVYEVAYKTVGGPSLVRDDGVDASAAFSPTRYMDLTVAFNRSLLYDLDTISVSMGFNISRILARPGK